MISVIDHAMRASGSPGDAAAYVSGVAKITPTTTITRLKTWNVVIITLEDTRPIAACII